MIQEEGTEEHAYELWLLNDSESLSDHVETSIQGELLLAL